MTPAEWLVDAVQNIETWQAKHSSLDKLRSALPDTETLTALRVSGNSGLADQYSAAEHALADQMRELDAQVNKTVADIQAAVPNMLDADRAAARSQLVARNTPVSQWVVGLLDAPRPITKTPPAALRTSSRSSSSSPLPIILLAGAGAAAVYFFTRKKT